MNSITIYKLGGDLLENPQKYAVVTEELSASDKPFILVHGGGKKASILSEALGITPVMIGGRRVTDQKTLEIAVMTYAGWLNTTLVADLAAKGVEALGMTGADLMSIQSRKRPPQPEADYGFVGDIEKIKTQRLQHLLELGICPVFCAITADASGQLLNTNADAVAGHLAGAFAEEGAVVSLNYLFEHAGILRHLEDPNSVLPQISRSDAESYATSGILHGGMLAKTEEGFRAAERGVSVRIGSFQDIRKLASGEAGTRLTATKPS